MTGFNRAVNSPPTTTKKGEHRRQKEKMNKLRKLFVCRKQKSFDVKVLTRSQELG